MPYGISPTLLIGIGIALFILLCVYVVASKFTRAYRFSKRIENYTIDPVQKYGTSIGDRFYVVGLEFLNRFSMFLAKIPGIERLEKKYEVYLVKEEHNDSSFLELIAIQGIWGLFLLGLYFVLCGIRVYQPSIFFALFFFLLGFFLPNVYWEVGRVKRNQQIEEDLLKAITMMENAFEVGKSITQALEIVSRELDGPLGEEFSKMNIDLKFGLELEMVLERFYERVPIEEVHYITTSLIVLNRTGGNISKIFSSIKENFIDRKKLSQELKSTTASASLVCKILMCLPFIIVLLIRLLSPSYFQDLFTSWIGLILLMVIVLLYTVYILVIHHIMKIDY